MNKSEGPIISLDPVFNPEGASRHQGPSDLVERAVTIPPQSTTQTLLRKYVFVEVGPDTQKAIEDRYEESGPYIKGVSLVTHLKAKGHVGLNRRIDAKIVRLGRFFGGDDKEFRAWFQGPSLQDAGRFVFPARDELIRLERGVVSDVEESMFVGVVKRVEMPERMHLRYSFLVSVRLESIDKGYSTRLDIPQPFSIRDAFHGLNVVDRELMTRSRFVSSLSDHAPYEIVEHTPEVVQNLSCDKADLDGRLDYSSDLEDYLSTFDFVLNDESLWIVKIVDDERFQIRELSINPM